MSEKAIIKDRLKYVRKLNNVSQSEVANAVGITKSAYSNYEQGTREPSLFILVKLCNYFSVSADYLLGLKEL